MTLPERAIWGIVPVKGFSRAKSRLEPALTPAVRNAFARGLFEHVHDTFRAVPEIRGVLVLTDDDEVEALARARGAHVLRDAGSTGLASIVDGGLRHVALLGADAALVCMSDLPHLATSDLEEVSAALRRTPVVLAPDALEAGTNLLGLSPPTRMLSCFGRGDSFATHLARARSEGHEATVLRLHGLCFDVDGPEDLLQLV